MHIETETLKVVQLLLKGEGGRSPLLCLGFCITVANLSPGERSLLLNERK